MNQLLAWLNLYHQAKYQFISSVHFWNTVNFSVPWPVWLETFLSQFGSPETGLHTYFFVNKILCLQNHFKCTSVHVKEQTCTLLIIIWYSIRNCSKLVLQPFAAKNSLYFSPVYCSFPADYTISIYIINSLYSCTLRDLFT